MLWIRGPLEVIGPWLRIAALKILLEIAPELSSEIFLEIPPECFQFDEFFQKYIMRRSHGFVYDSLQDVCLHLIQKFST